MLSNTAYYIILYTLKNAGLFQPKFGSNMDKPKCWVKNAIKKMYSWNWKLRNSYY